MVYVFCKPKCVACKLIISQLEKHNVVFETVIDNSHTVPIVQIDETAVLYSPITTHRLLVFLKQHGVIER